MRDFKGNVLIQYDPESNPQLGISTYVQDFDKYGIGKYSVNIGESRLIDFEGENKLIFTQSIYLGQAEGYRGFLTIEGIFENPVHFFLCVPWVRTKYFCFKFGTLRK